jgi:hypothetical protein
VNSKACLNNNFTIFSWSFRKFTGGLKDARNCSTPASPRCCILYHNAAPRPSHLPHSQTHRRLQAQACPTRSEWRRHPRDQLNQDVGFLLKVVLLESLIAGLGMPVSAVIFCCSLFPSSFHVPALGAKSRLWQAVFKGTN